MLNKNIIKSIFLGVVLTVGATFSQVSLAQGFVAMLLPENVNPRWENQDARAFVDEMKRIAPDVNVEVFNANNDPSVQQRQAEQALTRGADVLVVIPIDGDAASVIADFAKDADVPVIAYDRMINSKNTDFWVQADLRASGSEQARSVVANTKRGDTLVLLKGSPTDPNAGTIYQGQMDVLAPLFKSGERINGYENDTPGWDPAIARRSMDQALTKLKNNVDGVVASNDGNAGAAIAALEEQGLAGKVPVSGLDGTVASLQLMLLGEQTQTIWRPLEKMARVTANVTKALLDGKPIDAIANGKSPANGAGKRVPAALVEFYSGEGNTAVHYIIENDPTISKSDVCKGKAARTDFCQ